MEVIEKDENASAIHEHDTTFDRNNQYQQTPTAGNPAENKLLRLARYLLEGLMSGDITHRALQLLSPDFTVTHDRAVTTSPMNIHQFLAFVAELEADDYFVGTRLEIAEEWVDFAGTPESPHATVWRRVEHQMEGIVGNGLRIQKWRGDPASEEGWSCYYAGVFISAPFMSGRTNRDF